MTHKQAYKKAAELAKQHRFACDELAKFELDKWGFEFAETDSDPIIDTINYGIDSCSFEEYVEHMEYYKEKSRIENENN